MVKLKDVHLPSSGGYCAEIIHPITCNLLGSDFKLTYLVFYCGLTGVLGIVNILSSVKIGN